MSTPNQACAPLVIAASAGCTVSYCENCAQVQIQLPHLSFRIKLDLFADMAACIDAATREIPATPLDVDAEPSPHLTH